MPYWMVSFFHGQTSAINGKILPQILNGQRLVPFLKVPCRVSSGNGIIWYWIICDWMWLECFWSPTEVSWQGSPRSFVWARGCNQERFGQGRTWMLPAIAAFSKFSSSICIISMISCPVSTLRTTANILIFILTWCKSRLNRLMNYLRIQNLFDRLDDLRV